MFARLTKSRKADNYEDLDGEDRVEMDITDPTMRRYAAGVTDDKDRDQPSSTPTDHPEGLLSVVCFIRLSFKCL